MDYRCTVMLVRKLIHCFERPTRRVGRGIAKPLGRLYFVPTFILCSVFYACLLCFCVLFFLAVPMCKCSVNTRA